MRISDILKTVVLAWMVSTIAVPASYAGMVKLQKQRLFTHYGHEIENTPEIVREWIHVGVNPFVRDPSKIGPALAKMEKELFPQMSAQDQDFKDPECVRLGLAAIEASLRTGDFKKCHDDDVFLLDGHVVFMMSGDGIARWWVCVFQAEEQRKKDAGLPYNEEILKKGVRASKIEWEWKGKKKQIHFPHVCVNGLLVVTTQEPPPPPVDLCPNLIGTQESVPAGMIRDDAGNCVNPPVDVCPNIEGVQTQIPEGMLKDSAGNCMKPSPLPPEARAYDGPDIFGGQSSAPVIDVPLLPPSPASAPAPEEPKKTEEPPQSPAPAFDSSAIPDPFENQSAQSRWSPEHQAFVWSEHVRSIDGNNGIATSAGIDYRYWYRRDGTPTNYTKYGAQVKVDGGFGKTGNPDRSLSDWRYGQYSVNSIVERQNDGNTYQASLGVGQNKSHWENGDAHGDDIDNMAYAGVYYEHESASKAPVKVFAIWANAGYDINRDRQGTPDKTGLYLGASQELYQGDSVHAGLGETFNRTFAENKNTAGVDLWLSDCDDVFRFSIGGQRSFTPEGVGTNGVGKFTWNISETFKK